MAEFLPSPVDRRFRRSWLSTLGWVSALGLAVVVVKPWDLGGAPVATSAVPSRSARPAATPPPPRTAYDPRLFGGREPDPAWELWPAGYVVQFGMAGPLPVRSGDPGASDAPAASPSAVPSGLPTGATSPSAEAVDPDVIDLGPADHLIALGINTPANVRIAGVELLFHRGEDCCLEPIAVIRLATPWPSRHFRVIGIADPASPGEPGPWLIGEYRLDLLLDSGETRIVRFRVGAPLG